MDSIMKTCAVIMAGGKGERFWPKSRRALPKQFLSLTGDGKTMLQKTVERILPLIDIEDVYVVTNKDYIKLVKEQLPDIIQDNIIVEPCSRNTAPAIAIAAAYINKKYEDATMVVLPSDHLIRYENLFLDTVKSAVAQAQEDSKLVTLGIVPSAPETGYGYIKFISDKDGKSSFIYPVEKFVEKPNIDLAKEYLNSGEYLWNSGIFIWNTSTIIDAIKTFIPDIYQAYCRIFSAIGTEAEAEVIEIVFEKIVPISIDFGVMEYADNIYTIPGSFGWDDVGSWLALERINRTNDDGNYVKGDVITIDTNSSTIIGNKKLIASVGMKDVIIVDTDDALLVCNKEDAQSIKNVIKTLKNSNRYSLL